MQIDRRISKTDVRAWLDRWTGCINRCDYAGARALFSADVLGFGTVAVHARGIDSLVEQQWKKVWSNTEGFRFDDATLEMWKHGGLVAVAVRWHSQGIDPDSRELFPRSGRATILLEIRDGKLTAVHTHFSLNPAPERFWS